MVKIQFYTESRRITLYLFWLAYVTLISKLNQLAQLINWFYVNGFMILSHNFLMKVFAVRRMFVTNYKYPPFHQTLPHLLICLWVLYWRSLTLLENCLPTLYCLTLLGILRTSLKFWSQRHLYHSHSLVESKCKVNNCSTWDGKYFCIC